MKHQVPTHTSVVRTETPTLLIIDVSLSGLVVETMTGPMEELEAILPSLQLHLPHSKRPKLESSSLRLEGEPRDAIEEVIARHNMNETIIVFGFMSDPFFPFEGKFDTSLRILELLAARPPRQLIVQTRSPLVVIALPLLKGLGERASVTVALEALDDGVSIKLAPKLPRPSERIKTARALKRFGISVTAQVAPLMPLKNVETLSRQIAETLDDISSSIRVISPHSVGWSEKSQFNPSSAEALNGALMNALQRIAPEKMIDPTVRVKTVSSETLAA